MSAEHLMGRERLSLRKEENEQALALEEGLSEELEIISCWVFAVFRIERPLWSFLSKHWY